MKHIIMGKRVINMHEPEIKYKQHYSLFDYSSKTDSTNFKLYVEMFIPNME